MGKFHGSIGFGMTVETSPGIWTDEIVETEYVGTFVKRYERSSAGQGVNQDLTVSGEISILSDPVTNQNLEFIRYVKYLGSKWRVSSVRIELPRIYLTLGGFYNDGV